LPAHGSLRIPLKVRAITQKGPAGDTASHKMGIYSISDSAGILRYSTSDFALGCITNYSGQFGAWQNSLPPNDSGGRWLPSGVTLESVAGYNTVVYIPTMDKQYSSYKLGDSAFYLADSMYINLNGYTQTVTNPWKYIDSVAVKTGELYFTLKPYQVLHLPVWIQATGTPGDTIFTHTMFINAIANVAGKNVYSAVWLQLRCIAACSAPYVSFSGQPFDNKDQPAVIGITPTNFWGRCLNCGAGITHISYSIRGEYPDSFTLPADTLFNPIYDNRPPLVFSGAPKSPIHDTLIATSTNCWGSITTRTPITAYSKRKDGYVVRNSSLTLTAPFLGRAEGNGAVVINTSDFPISLRNLNISSYDSVDFEISAPALIAPYDSGIIRVVLKDKDIGKDTLYASRSATITGIIAPYGQNLGFADSIFSFGVSGAIDVYSPKYFSLIPLLKHGVHPKGIVFTSSVSSLSGPHTFLTVYGNNDPTAEYFGMPYYDDPHFSLNIGNYTGFGSVSLPGVVLPDTGFLGNGIEVLTTFTGDSHLNYQTQIHWPRESDTVTIDVVCLGAYATPFQDVAGSGHMQNVHLWPNPASNLVRIDIPQSVTVWISDELGRLLIKTTLTPDSPTIDVSKLPAGLYEVSIPSLGVFSKLEIIR